MFAEKMTSLLSPIWQEVKLQRRCLLRWISDVQDGQRRLLAQKKGTHDAPFTFQLVLTQLIRPGTTYSNKLSNIRLASGRINQLQIEPGQIFSFWTVVGRPSTAQGFRLSRNIISGQISEAIGGGLCQVSGILYHLALLSGLDILERHSHSLDIYSEEERFSPLGADAAVVYGYKDLRVRNGHAFPVIFSMEVKDDQLKATLSSQQSIEEIQIEFRRESDRNSVRTVTTLCYRKDQSQILNQSVYQIAAHSN